MSRDYKEAYNKYISKKIFPPDWETFKKDLLLDCPNVMIVNAFKLLEQDEDFDCDTVHPTTPRGYCTFSDHEIESFCNKHSKFEWWARVVDALIDWAGIIDGGIYSDNTDFNDTSIQEHLKRSSDILRDFINFHANAFVRAFNYYHKIEAGRLITSTTDSSSDKSSVSPTTNTHYDSLLDVVCNLPEGQPGTPQFGDQFKQAINAINGWLDIECAKWEKDILTTIPNEKMGMYFLGKATELLDEFHDYIPSSKEDWYEMKTGSNCFFCLAMDYYFDKICDLILHYDIKEDEYTKRMNDICWFLFDIDSFYDDEKNCPKPQDKKLKDFLDEVVDYAKIYKDYDDFDEHDYLEDKIKEWVDLNVHKIEDDLVHIIAHDKISIYLFNIVRNLLDDFRDYIPLSYEDFAAGQKGEHWYYYDALNYYIDCIVEDIYLYDIKVDKYINMIYESIKYFACGESTVKTGEPEKDLDEIFNPSQPKYEEFNALKSSSLDPINNYIIADDPEAIKIALTSLLKGTKGKTAAYYVLGAVTNRYLNKPSFDILQSAFGILGSKQGFNNYYNDKKTYYDEKEEKEINTAKAKVKQTYETIRDELKTKIK